MDVHKLSRFAYINIRCYNTKRKQFYDLNWYIFCILYLLDIKYDSNIIPIYNWILSETRGIWHNISANNAFGDLPITQGFSIRDVASICDGEDVVQLISSILVHFYAYFDHYMWFVAMLFGWKLLIWWQ